MNLLTELRKSADLTQTEVGDALGITQSAVSHWEVGRGNPRTKHLPTLAALYQCTVEDLLTIARFTKQFPQSP